MIKCNVCMIITSLISLINLGRNEILICGGKYKLQKYDDTRQKCDKGEVLDLSNGLVCGPLMTKYDLAVYECVEGIIVVKNVTSTPGDRPPTTTKSGSNSFTGNSFNFTVVIAGLVCFVVHSVFFF